MGDRTREKGPHCLLPQTDCGAAPGIIGAMSGTFYRIQLSDGRSFQAHPDQTVLQASLAADMVMASSCRNGTCRACMCKLAKGQVRCTLEWPGLSREEKEDGWILPCVSVATSDLMLQVSP